MRIHWSDCAVNNGPAYPAGPCDCGMLDLTEDAREEPVASPISLSRSLGFLVQDAEANSLIEKQDLPPIGFIADAATSDLPDPHGAVIGGGDTARVDFDNAGVPVVANLKASP